MWPQGGNRVKRNGEKVTETVTDLFFFRNDRFWPILLKKSTSNSTAKKYASEIEI